MITKKTVSRRAVFARIARKLEKRGEYLHSCPQKSRWYSQLGEYYVTNDRNNIEDTHRTLENLAHEEGVLRAYEQIEEQE